MKSRFTSLCRPLALLWPSSICLAMVCAAVPFAGLWTPAVAGNGWQVFLPAVLLAATGILGLFASVRSRAARRLKLVLDAYAEREIARERRRRRAAELASFFSSY